MSTGSVRGEEGRQLRQFRMMWGVELGDWRARRLRADPHCSPAEESER